MKKFIVSASKEQDYRLEDTEEEKKLPLSDEKSPAVSTTELINQYYRIGKVLGKGAFGKVNLAI